MIIYIKNMLQFVIILFAVFYITGCENEPSNVSIIPEPLELKINNGNFTVDEKTKVIVDSNNPKVKDVANYFTEQFNNASGYSIEIVSSSEKNDVNNSITFTDKKFDASLGDEGYKLISDEDKVVLTGTPSGLFYGVQTLFQILPVEIYNPNKISNINWQIPSVEIMDKPRFKWRGMHLDVGRFMFPVSFIKKYIDYIAMHKMNTFHWHLTDDQGWRIEIKKYPRLTEIGSWRKGTTLPELNKPDVLDGKPYGGFYTQDEIRDIVNYAQKRFITVVPEIEMPGHSVAALASYPELSCTGGPFEVRTKWSFSENLYCAGNDDTFLFLENVLAEVMELFPSEYIHIGGDEAPKTKWKECTKCQLRMKNEGLKDEEELQSYFISRIEKFINSKGRKIIGWNEIMQGGLAPNAAIMSWGASGTAVSAAKQKHYSVMCPGSHCYFDHYQGKPEEEPRAMEGFLPLERVYSYDPVPEELSKEEEKYILGVQGNVWTEFIRTTDQVEYMAFPRMCALAEVAWATKEKQGLPDFLNRLDAHFGRLDELSINYRWPRLQGFENKNIFIDEFKVEFNSKRKNVEIRYTLDGTTPTKNSTLFETPFRLSETATLHVTEFSLNGKNSPVYKIDYIKQIPLKPALVKGENEGLKFEYYEFDKPIDSTLDLLRMKPVKNGIVQKFVFPFDNEKLPDYFGVIYKGFISVPSEGIYTFSVSSNDGTRLFIGDKLIVENDGWHGPYEKEGAIALQAGQHKIKLLYFQSGGRKSLEVFTKNSKDKKEEIIKSVLFY